MTLLATVIIPTFEDWDSLQSCLDCLAQQTADPSLFEVIVANNNPSPEVPASLRLPNNARVIHQPKPGSYAARNAAIRVASGKVLFFTDSDCLPDTRWIETGLAAMDTMRPPALIAGGIDVFPAGQRWTSTELYDRVFSLRQEELARKGHCVTANLITYRDSFDTFGLFSEDRFSGGDGAWTSQATDSGCAMMYCAAAKIRHPARAGFAALAKKRRRLIGAVHQDEILGFAPKTPLWRYFGLIKGREISRALTFPGLTGGQRMQLLWIAYRLGLVTLGEIVRLRFLRSGPNRS